MGGSSPCASCKLLRRRCTKECIFAPYFPSDDPRKFAIVHKVFGASNVSKMLQELPIHQRGDAVSSLVYEANARVRDPVYGCVGAISYLQNQVTQLQMQLAVAQAEILSIQMQPEPSNNNTTLLPSQLLLDQDDNEKFLLLSTSSAENNNNYEFLPQYLSSFASSSSSSSNVFQDSEPLKRESFC
ncbi:LOB domain-containing protein 12 [Stylosanthes scabra]|uniref:LOB domain-containing protein 12 n=1 Tax=Stylosanthes scabra TaxID=79078 RepID=A0ABU6TPB3_9FABA|nr:LOB domain-containing protein 12 [Stylosanthes scabra]